MKEAGAIGVSLSELNKESQERLKPLLDSIVNSTANFLESNHLTLHESRWLVVVAELKLRKMIKKELKNIYTKTLFIRKEGEDERKTSC